MFTGIIQTQGTLIALRKNQQEARLTIQPKHMFNSLQQGESIAVNGVCLTVENFNSTTFTAFASATTMDITNLGLLSENSLVNLERALAVGNRLGGHIVSGHVDCLTQFLSLEEDISSKKCTFTLPNGQRSLIISKGSVTLDGISLTVTSCSDSTFSVNIIPETWAETTAKNWRQGSLVNLETDLIGKYVQAHLLYFSPERTQNSAITEDFLQINGFL